MKQDSFDVVIVGSGPVGSTVARTLSDEASGLRVLLVEAGPLVTDPPGRHVKTLADPAAVERAQRLSQAGRPTTAPPPGAIAARPGTYLVGDGKVAPDGTGLPAAAMSKNVGGMGAHWTCACPVPGDGERIPWIPRPDFDQVFDDAWRLLHVTQEAFEGWPLGAEVRAALRGALDPSVPADRQVQPMPLAIRVAHGDRYWTGTDVILGDAVTSGSVELRAETTATRIERDGDRVFGLTLRDRDGRESTVKTRAVFVAADSFRTPQLLHASGIRPSALGRYLNDHLQVMALARLDDSLIPDTVRTESPRTEGTLELFSGVNWIPYDQERSPFHGQIMQMDASPVPIENVTETWPGSIVGIGLFGCKEIRPEDRVTFDDSNLDESGLPAIGIEYALTETDRATIADMQRAAGRLADALGGLVEGQSPTALPNGNSLHYMGTVRMGAADDGASVCDPFGRVWGTQGLYVGGNGVIPTPTACNPTATSVALAIRSARALIDDMRQLGVPTKENPIAT
ncbi:GMC oxidoreductase [Microbacterium trichothecenolyticum]|uniref:GMC oxidoreductase n=1 Tax=Microbacterium trichothecenolyticum TaxID=69370 RepID=UPI0035BE9FDA